jgi:hypothetical protein
MARRRKNFEGIMGVPLWALLLGGGAIYYFYHQKKQCQAGITALVSEQIKQSIRAGMLAIPKDQPVPEAWKP